LELEHFLARCRPRIINAPSAVAHLLFQISCPFCLNHGEISHLEAGNEVRSGILGR
jgi:hypothetical protein